MHLTFDDTFAPPYRGKLFKIKPGKLTYLIDIDASEITQEGKALKSLTERMWKKEMEHFRTAKEKEYAKVITITERNIYKTLAKKAQKTRDPKKLEKWLAEEAKGANVMIANAIKTLESLANIRAKKVYAQAAEAVDKKFKTHLRNQKVKVGVKIAGHVTLILVAGALAIAAGVAGVVITAATSGVGALSFAVIAPAVAGAVLTIAKSGKSIFSTVQRDWPKCEKAMQQLEKATKALLKSVEYRQKKREKKDLMGRLGPRERLKLLLNDVKGDVKAVRTALTNCAAYAVTVDQEIERLAQEITKLQKPIDELKATPDDVNKRKVAPQYKKLLEHQIQMFNKVDKARDYLKKLMPLMIEGQKLVESTDLENPNKLKVFLRKLHRFITDDSVDAALSGGKNVLTNAGSLVMAFKPFM